MRAAALALLAASAECAVIPAQRRLSEFDANCSEVASRTHLSTLTEHAPVLAKSFWSKKANF